jgi:hypothetical protein
MLYIFIGSKLLILAPIGNIFGAFKERVISYGNITSFINISHPNILSILLKLYANTYRFNSVLTFLTLLLKGMCLLPTTSSFQRDVQPFAFVEASHQALL